MAKQVFERDLKIIYLAEERRNQDIGVLVLFSWNFKSSQRDLDRNGIRLQKQGGSPQLWVPL